MVSAGSSAKSSSTGHILIPTLLADLRQHQAHQSQWWFLKQWLLQEGWWSVKRRQVKWKRYYACIHGHLQSGAQTVKLDCSCGSESLLVMFTRCYLGREAAYLGFFLWTLNTFRHYMTKYFREAWSKRLWHNLFIIDTCVMLKTRFKAQNQGLKCCRARNLVQLKIQYYFMLLKVDYAVCTSIGLTVQNACIKYFPLP